jgi:imidazoleglycerol-phosphate dehydratase
MIKNFRNCKLPTTVLIDVRVLIIEGEPLRFNKIGINVLKVLFTLGHLKVILLNTAGSVNETLIALNLLESLFSDNSLKVIQPNQLKNSLTKNDKTIVVIDSDTKPINSLDFSTLGLGGDFFSILKLEDLLNYILPPRYSQIYRKTCETDISLSLNLNGSGEGKIDTGIGFFDHMLNLFAFHSKFDLTLKCEGDLIVDAHHTIEDVAIALGMAFKQALGDKIGIERYADISLPMDEAIAKISLDISGRPYLRWSVEGLDSSSVGHFPCEMTYHFFYSFVIKSEITLHIESNGENKHHIIEGIFKGVARALKLAASCTDNRLNSTKGLL